MNEAIKLAKKSKGLIKQCPNCGNKTLEYTETAVRIFFVTMHEKIGGRGNFRQAKLTYRCSNCNYENSL